MFVALSHHDARVGGSIPGLGGFNTVTYNMIFFIATTINRFASLKGNGGSDDVLN